MATNVDVRLVAIAHLPADRIHERDSAPERLGLEARGFYTVALFLVICAGASAGHRLPAIAVAAGVVAVLLRHSGEVR